MITKEIALTLKYRQTLYHTSLKNADGTKLRVRVNGKVKTWKREPERFEVPVKHGLYDFAYITNYNGDRYTLEE